MPHIKADLIQETTASNQTGAGALVLNGATAGHFAVASVMADGDTAVFKIQNNAIPGEVETVLCEYSTGANSLTPSTVYKSPSGSLVNFSAGVKTISLIATAEKVITADPSGDAVIPRDLSVTRSATVSSTLSVGSITAAEALDLTGSMYMRGNPRSIYGEGRLDIQGGSGTGINLKTNAGVTNAVEISSAGGVTLVKALVLAADVPEIDFSEADTGTLMRLLVDGSSLQVMTAAYQTLFSVANTGAIGLGAGAWEIPVSGVFRPTVDNALNIGGPSNRAATIYAGTGTINTSGREAKRFIGSANDAERRAAARIRERGPRRYKLADAVETKGEARARWHFGYVAEDVRDDLAAEGLDPWSYGFMCRDPITKRETYTVKVMRDKTRTVSVVENVIEVRDGKPVLVRRQTERDEVVGSVMPVLDENGQPVTVEARDEGGEIVQVPMQHFVAERVEVEVERFREVDTGEERLGLRYSELEAFLRCAD